MNNFWNGFEKQAGLISKAVKGMGHSADFAHAAELTGLGILAAPGVKELAEGKKEGKGKNIAETVGLGVLALPSAAHFASKLMTKGKK